MLTKETRKLERISIQTNASIEADSPSGDCILMDFSSHGLGLLLNHSKVDVGQKLNVNLETAPWSTTAQGIIKWARKLKENNFFNYAIGLELIELDTDGYGNLLQHAQS